MRRRLCGTAVLLVAGLGLAGAAEPTSGPTDTYRALAERKIGQLGLSHERESERLIESTVTYLTGLERVLNDRAETIRGLEATSKPADGAAVTRAYVVARDRFTPMKRAYVAELNTMLTPYQVERVKDGLTGDALPRLHAMYLEMVPELTPIERALILGLLVEMRENAMTAIDATAQEQWQDKYRGKINNYIARQGHDFRTLSKAWDAKHGQAK